MRLVTTLLIALRVRPCGRHGADGVETTAIRFGKLWDGSTVTTDAVVVVNGDRITVGGDGQRRGARAAPRSSIFGSTPAFPA